MTKINLTLPHRTNPQRLIQEANQRFKIGVWGRQSGKTTNGNFTMVKRPLQGPKYGRYWHLLQTYSAAEICFNRFVRQFPKSSWGQLWSKKPNESEKTVFLTGFREVSFKSGRDYNNLLTETLHGAIIDECREQEKELWERVIRPMLAKYKGWCDFYSTPNGFDWFYDLYTGAQENPAEWFTVKAPSTEAPWWTPQEIESVKKDMSEPMFAQEILAEFRDLQSGKVYINAGPHNYTDQNPYAPRGQEWSPYLPIIVGLDFNVSPMAWHLCQYKPEDKLYVGDRIWLENSHTQEATLELINRVKGHRPGLTLIGDATGKARKTASAGQTDYSIIEEMLRAHGIPFNNLTPTENPLVKDRVNIMNARLKSATGEIRILVNPIKCPEAKRDFERVVWKPGADATIDKTKDLKLTHASDSIGYPVCVLMPLKSIGEVGTLKVIYR